MSPRAVWLLGFALLLRVLTPAGYMVDPVRAAGAWPIVLCPDGLPSGALTLTARPTETGGAHRAAHDDRSAHRDHGASDSADGGQAAKAGGECAFSGVASAAEANAPPAASPLALAAPPPALPASAIGRGLAAPPPPATGPPPL